MGSNKNEKRKPKSAVYRSFWASVVYFHLRLISTKNHKGEMTRNQVYRQRYRGFESHPLRQKKAHPSGWAFFWHYDPGAGGIRKAALGGMPVACRNRRGFSAEKGSHPLRQLVANYAGSRRLFYAAHEKVISYLLRCSSLQNRDRFAGSRFCFFVHLSLSLVGADAFIGPKALVLLCSSAERRCAERRDLSGGRDLRDGQLESEII